MVTPAVYENETLLFFGDEIFLYIRRLHLEIADLRTGATISAFYSESGRVGESLLYLKRVMVTPAVYENETLLFFGDEIFLYIRRLHLEIADLRTGAQKLAAVYSERGQRHK